MYIFQFKEFKWLMIQKKYQSILFSKMFHEKKYGKFGGIKWPNVVSLRGQVTGLSYLIISTAFTQLDKYRK